MTANFFDVLGVQAGLGRTFRAEEDRPGGLELWSWAQFEH